MKQKGVLRKRFDKVMMNPKYVYPCGGYFKHNHTHEWTALLCGNVQALFPLAHLHFWILKKFNPVKLDKIIKANTGSNKRALIRRRIKGMKLI